MAVISEDYVSFETAKLLKEKGFDEYCHLWYNLDKPIKYPFFYKEIGWYGRNSYDYNGKRIATAPTLQMAMRWLREVHDIFIKLEFDIDENIQWHPSLTLIKGNKYIHTNELQWYDTYEQACEVAIKYCLEHLI